jgi:4-aminobutyrate aminotransferase-like enzyme/Ser/Thr protein kinase RdoA (MazF antagonist)
MKIFSTAEAELFIKKHYGLDVSASSLVGYDEQNFLLQANGGKKWVLKIATDEHNIHFLDAQVKIINHLVKSNMKSKFQQFLLNADGKELTIIVIENINYYLRVLTYIDGTFWVDQQNKTALLYKDFGNFLGQMDKGLDSFSHPAMHRHYTWDISTAADANRKLKYIINHEKRRIAGYFLMQFETEVLPELSSLPHAYVHNDANDYNVLVSGDKVAGIIDFGDMVYTARINNLAVACTYAMLNNNEPLHTAEMIVKAYNEINTLTEKETDLLYYLIAGRLCISVTQSAYNASLDSNNEHHFITETPAWELLFKMIEINPIKAQDRFRAACGMNSIINNENYDALIQERKEHLGYNLSISYKKKLKIVKGALQYLYDDKGNTYVDCVNNPSHVGHCHPHVVKKMQKQIATLNTNTRYLNDNIIEFAKMLKKTLDPSLSVCYFTNSGSEANDLAIRMSRHFTKQKDVIVLDHAYHGTSTASMEMSPYKFDGKGGFGKMPWIHKAMNPDQYRGPYQYDDDKAGEKYAADVQRIIEELKKENKFPAAYICETLLGVGGQMPLPSGYLKEVYKHVKAAGGLCIADEVQVGFGRVGEKFWGYELQDVLPDIVVMGKPIGNGHPLAAVVVTKEIATVFNNGMEFFNTFGGNPVSMATGIAVMDVINEEELQNNALEVGNHLMEGLRDLMQKHFIIGDVRGHGLFVGAELVRDRITKEPAVPEIDDIVEQMKERGFLLSTDGPLYNVLKIKPPIVFSKKNADDMVRNLDEVMSGMK